MTDCESRVVDLAHDGNGVVKIDGRVYFVPGVLPGELIRFKPGKKRRGKYLGVASEVVQASEDRVEPDCIYFGICGGCVMQHIQTVAQLKYKEQILFDNLERIGKVTAENRLPPVQGDAWHYRRKARLGVKFVPKKDGILVGFREPQSSFITSLMDCKTLDRKIAALLPGLHTLVSQLSNNHRIPQIEVAAGDNHIALVIRHLEPLSNVDISALQAYARDAKVIIYSQSGGPDTVKPIAPDCPPRLSYKLEDFEIILEFNPTDFIQVNAAVNKALVKCVVTILDPQPTDYVLDLFCGLGNFTLAIARSGATVFGVEGDSDLVRRGAENAQLNGIENAVFHQQDLLKESVNEAFLDPSVFSNLDQRVNKMVIDPPRSGALGVVSKTIPKLNPDRVVYVSCNSATLARDANVMVYQNGYRLTHAGVINMFPHTAHIESMAIFEAS